MQDREWVESYAREVASALLEAGQEPPEHFAYGMRMEAQKGLFKTRQVQVPFRESAGAGWEIYRIRKMYLLSSVDMRGNPYRLKGESVGMMHETYSVVIWLRGDGALVVLEETDVERQYVTPTRRDVTYKPFEDDALRHPDSDISYREDEAQAQRAGYLVWGEWSGWRRLYEEPYTGLSLALKQAATNLGVDVADPRR